MATALVEVTTLWLLSGCDLVFGLSPRPDADAAPDAGFDIANCPSTYTVVLPDQPSRYRVIKTQAAPWLHSDDCDNDLLSATHLAALDDLGEILAAQIYVNAVANQPLNRTWVGAIQRMDAAAPDDAWITTGDVDLPNYWCLPTEPNDGGSGLERGQEQFAAMDRNGSCFVDAPGTESVGGLCECDGRPRGRAAGDLIDLYKTR